MGRNASTEPEVLYQVLEKVSRLLGHSSIQQTLAYAEIVRTDVARSMRRAEESFATAVGRRTREVKLAPPKAA